ncbi:MAG: hypothetical protein PVH18_11155 [Chloroflexota bacterium]|jgi:hypothetical protein
MAKAPRHSFRAINQASKCGQRVTAAAYQVQALVPQIVITNGKELEETDGARPSQDYASKHQDIDQQQDGKDQLLRRRKLAQKAFAFGLWLLVSLQIVVN